MAKHNAPAARRIPSQRPPAPEPEPEVEEVHEEPAGSESLQLLREEALQHEVEFDDDTTEEDLRELVEQAKVAEVKAHEAQLAENARMKAAPPAGAPARSRGATGRTGGKAKASKESKSRIGKPSPEKLALLGLPDPTDEDFALAEQYDYPIAIPGAQAYKIGIAITCPFGGGERPAGSVMLIHDAYAANKLEHLTPV